MDKSEVFRALREMDACASARMWAAYAKGTTARELWEECPDASWLVWLLVYKIADGDIPEWPDRKAVLVLLCDLVEEFAVPHAIESEEFLRNFLKETRACISEKLSLVEFETCHYREVAILRTLGIDLGDDSNINACVYQLAARMHTLLKLGLTITTTTIAQFMVMYTARVVAHGTNVTIQDALDNIAHYIRTRIDVPL